MTIIQIPTAPPSPSAPDPPFVKPGPFAIEFCKTWLCGLNDPARNQPSLSPHPGQTSALLITHPTRTFTLLTTRPTPHAAIQLARTILNQKFDIELERWIETPLRDDERRTERLSW
ncbi:hypothetical protein G7Y79_00015g038230 [Physcia stellaris]|nr:hypothetical protein G7Y79_00015g038230 [Physcia stellaris]